MSDKDTLRKSGSEHPSEAAGSDGNKIDAKASSTHSPDQPDPIIGMTRAEKQTIKDSWNKIIGETQEDSQEAGIQLLLWMFDNIPNMRKVFVFGKKDSDQLRADELFVSHTQRVILAVNDLVILLDDSTKLVAAVNALAKSHVRKKPPASSNYFLVFAEKFHMFLKKTIDVGQDSEEVRLWTALLNIIAATVVDVEKMEKSSNKKGCCSCTLA